MLVHIEDASARPPTDGTDGGSAESGGVLADPYARRAVEALRRTERPVDVSDLAREVAAMITDEPPDDVPNDVARRIQTWLHHGHLPELVARDVVRYDSESGQVRLADGHRGERPGI